jgi:hypothetical protein
MGNRTGLIKLILAHLSIMVLIIGLGTVQANASGISKVDTVLGISRLIAPLGTFSLVTGGDLQYTHPIAQGVRIGDSVYVVSGNIESRGVNIPYIERTDVLPSGEITPWVTAGKIKPRDFACLAATANNIYIIGNHPGSTLVTRVPIVNGSLQPEITEKSLSVARYGAQAFIIGNYLYVAGGANNSLNPSVQTSVERALINSNGSIGDWQAAPPLRIARTGLALFKNANYVWALGGIGATAALGSVERAVLAADGSIGSWQIINTTVPQLGYSTALLAGNYIYYTGGNGGSPNNQWLYAIPIAGGAELDPPIQCSTLQKGPRDWPVMFASPTYLYVTGGQGGSASGLNGWKETERAAFSDKPAVQYPGTTAKTAPIIPAVTQSVFFSPKTQIANPGGEVNINTDVKPAGWGVSAGEINISFDPRVLEAVDIKPGNLLGTNALVGAKTIDNTKGIITYSLARVGATSKSDSQSTFASTTFKVKPGTSGTSSIKLAKVGLSDENFKDIQGLSLDEATVNLSVASSPPTSIAKPSPPSSPTQKKTITAKDRILLDANANILESTNINNNSVYVMQYTNLLPFASGLEIYSDSGQKIVDQTNARIVLKTIAWKRAATKISSSDINTLQDILQTSIQVNQNVAPLRSATGSIVGMVNNLKSASVNVPLLGTKSAWDAAVAAYPQLSSLQASVTSLDNDLNDWAKATQSLTQDLPNAISGLQSAQASRQVTPDLAGSIERSISNFSTLQSKTTKVSGSLSDVANTLGNAQSSLSKASSTPYVGGYIGSFANYLGGLKSQVDSAKSSVQNYSSKLSSQSSNLKAVIDSATDNENNLFSSWTTRQGALTIIYIVVFGLMGLLVILEIILLILKKKKLGITFFILLMVCGIFIVINFITNQSNATVLTSDLGNHFITAIILGIR